MGLQNAAVNMAANDLVGIGEPSRLRLGFAADTKEAIVWRILDEDLVLKSNMKAASTAAPIINAMVRNLAIDKMRFNRLHPVRKNASGVYGE